MDRYDSIEDASAVLAARDPLAARTARDVATSIAGGDDPAGLSLAGLLHWLWYGFPMKWLMPDEDRPPVVAAVADFFDVLGRPTYAGWCRSDTTRKVHAAYRRSDTEGKRAYRKALAASGVEPVDIDEFAWGSFFGPEESAAYTVTERALENALAGGRIVPGKVGWKRASEAVVRVVLEGAHPDLPGQRRLDAVTTERLANWIDGGRRSPTMSRLRGAVANHLLHPVPIPVDAADVLEPVLWFCERISVGGVKFTQKGWLERSFVHMVARERDWWTYGGSLPRSEGEFPELATLRELVTGCRLAQREGDHLMLTIAGIDSSRQTGDVWRRVTAQLPGRRPFDRAAFETIMLTALATHEPCPRTDAILTATIALAEAGWTVSTSSTPPNEHQVAGAAASGMSVLRLLGVLDDEDAWRTDRFELTPAGRALVLAAVRANAAGPRRDLIA